jgi:hypothetical protein
MKYYGCYFKVDKNNEIEKALGTYTKIFDTMSSSKNILFCKFQLTCVSRNTLIKFVYKIRLKFSKDTINKCNKHGRYDFRC